MKRLDRNTIPSYLLALVILLLVSAAFTGMSHFWQGADPDRTDMVVEAIRKAAVQCYALEGSYPPDIAYMKEHYGLQFDEGRFAYRYEVFASNIMPDIEVHER